MWFNCKPDLTRLGQDYKNLNDRRIIERKAAGFEARLYDVWYIDLVKNVSKKGFDHPCPNPVELARRIVLTTTEPGDRVADPFAGSFTIPAVAAALGRYGIGIEQSENYCRIAEARLGTIENELGVKDEPVFAEAAE
jgi:DNA modification methylase